LLLNVTLRHYTDIMQRTIIQLLICSIFYGGLAWSSDSTADAYFSYASEVVSFDTASQNQSFKIDESCCHGEDHCCNAITHLAGFYRLSTNVMYMHLSNDTSHALNRFYSLTVAPPTPPPTS